MNLTVHTDGGSKGNPGPSAIGISMSADGKEVLSHREDIGITTNNDAEYRAVIRAFELISAKILKTYTPVRINFYSDSLLLVSQLNGVYKVRHPAIREHILTIRSLESQLGIPVTYTHVRRELNKRADDLVNGA